MQTKLDIHDFWVNQTKGSKQAVWLRSHVRLSRNLNGFPFSDQARPEQKGEITHQIQKAIQTLPTFSKDFVSFDWDKCSEHERSLLKTLCCLQDPCDETRIWLNRKEQYWCVSNDGDHLRLHARTHLWNLNYVWKKLDALDSQLESLLLYAFDPKTGYATCEPETYGNGLAITAITHLPGISFIQKTPQITEALHEMALSMAAQQIINSKPLGHLFLITNKTALGCSEVELLEHMDQQIRYLIEVEMRMRHEIFQQNTSFLKDSIGRSLGLLENCFELSFEEAMNLLSLVRMAIDLDLISCIKPESLNALWNKMPSINLKEFCSNDGAMENENCVRADIVRSFFLKNSKLALKKWGKEVSYAS